MVARLSLFFLFFFSPLSFFFLSLFGGHGRKEAIGLFIFFLSKLLILVGSLGHQSTGLVDFVLLYMIVILAACICVFSMAQYYLWHLKQLNNF